jgi:hypothetical protein
VSLSSWLELGAVAVEGGAGWSGSGVAGRALSRGIPVSERAGGRAEYTSEPLHGLPFPCLNDGAACILGGWVRAGERGERGMAVGL